MESYLVFAEDIRGHFCLGRVFPDKSEADKYCDYVNSELIGTHVDTTEGGHYFIFQAHVVQVDVDETLIHLLSKEREDLIGLNIWSARRLPKTWKDYAYDELDKITGQKNERP